MRSESISASLLPPSPHLSDIQIMAAISPASTQEKYSWHRIHLSIENHHSIVSWCMTDIKISVNFQTINCTNCINEEPTRHASICAICQFQFDGVVIFIEWGRIGGGPARSCVRNGHFNYRAPQVNPRVKRSSFMSGITLNQALKLALLWHIPWCQLSHPLILHCVVEDRDVNYRSKAQNLYRTGA